jgi:hypothetical protein
MAREHHTNHQQWRQKEILLGWEQQKFNASLPDVQENADKLKGQP